MNVGTVYRSDNLHWLHAQVRMKMERNGSLVMNSSSRLKRVLQIITAYGPVLLLCVLRKRKTKDMSARLVIIIPSNLLSQYSIFDESTNVGVGLIVDVDVLAAAFLLMVMGAVYKYTQERMPSTSMMMQIWMWRRRHNSMKLKMKRWMSRRMLLWTPVAEDTRWMARA